MHPFLKNSLSLFAVIFALSILNTEPAYADCTWNVSGNATVYNDLIRPDAQVATEPIHHATVKVWASILPAGGGGWHYWGSDTTDSSGNYSVTATPAQDDPIGCSLNRRFKVKIYLDNDKAQVVSADLQTRNILISNTSTWYSGTSVTINKTLNSSIDTDRSQLNGNYVDTRAAQLFVGYQMIYNYFDDNDFNPIKMKIVWPDGAGDKDYRRLWSPPGGYVRMPKSEFWNYNDSTHEWHYIDLNASNTLNTLLNRAKVQIHEIIHQWFNVKVFIPNFISGETAHTHEFTERPSVSFYEAFALVLSEMIVSHLRVGEEWSFKGSDIPTYYEIYSRFRNARHDNGDFYFNPGVLINMIDANSEGWQEHYFSAEYTAINYLKLLVVEGDWPGRNLGGNYSVRLLGSREYHLDFQRENNLRCYSIDIPMFKPSDLIYAALAWKNDSSTTNRVPDNERNILGFYTQMKRYDSSKTEYLDLFINWLNPHFAGENLNTEYCDEHEQTEDTSSQTEPYHENTPSDKKKSMNKGVKSL